MEFHYCERTKGNPVTFSDIDRVRDALAIDKGPVRALKVLKDAFGKGTSRARLDLHFGMTCRKGFVIRSQGYKFIIDRNIFILRLALVRYKGPAKE